MSSFTVFSIDGYPFLETSDVVPELMTVFRESDRVVTTLSEHDGTDPASRVSAGADASCADGADGGASHCDLRLLQYKCRTSIVIDRLNVMGFTIERARSTYEAMRDSRISDLKRDVEEDERDEASKVDLEIVQQLTFAAYSSTLKTILTKKWEPYCESEWKPNEPDPLVRHVLGDSDDYRFGFVAVDPRVLLRLLCELVARDSDVIQDVTELIQEGVYDETDAICEDAAQSLIVGHPENAPVIVITEGANDADILKSSMAILYPHLAPFYAFMEFHDSKAEGGVGRQIALVKALSGVRVSNRIVALFDNDTAARSAMKVLDAASLLPSIRVLRLPDLASLRSYPTLGPGGPIDSDINGLAASIEVYLGDDVLKVDGASRSPVQWMGYDQSLKQYQGEVLEKKKILDAFRAKLARCNADANATEQCDWVGIRAILSALFQAFE